MFLSHGKPNQIKQQRFAKPQGSFLGSEAQVNDHLNCILLRVTRVVCVTAPNCISGDQESKWPTMDVAGRCCAMEDSS